MPRTLICCAIAIALLAAMPAQGADPAESFSVTPHWNKDDVFRFQVIKTQTREVGGKQTVNTKVSYIQEIRVIDVTPDASNLQLTLLDFKLIEPPDPSGEAAAVLAETIKTPLKYLVNKQGEMLSVTNVDEQLAQTLRVLDAVNASKPEAFRKETHDSFAATAATPEYHQMMGKSLLAVPAPLHVFYNQTFVPNAKPEAVTLPSPVGNAELPAKATKTLKKSDPQQVELRLLTVCEPEAGKVVAKIIADLQKGAGEKVDVPDNFAFQMTQDFAATFRRDGVFPDAVHYERTAQVDDAKDVETVELRRLAPAQASQPARRNP